MLIVILIMRHEKLFKINTQINWINYNTKQYLNFDYNTIIIFDPDYPDIQASTLIQKSHHINNSQFEKKINIPYMYWKLLTNPLECLWPICGRRWLILVVTTVIKMLPGVCKVKKKQPVTYNAKLTTFYPTQPHKNLIIKPVTKVTINDRYLHELSLKNYIHTT